MKLTFMGTRGYIEERTRRHYMHSSLMVSYYGCEVMIDCGEDWLGNLDKVNPEAIFITHAHPDHAGGLENGASCPVFATEETWEDINDFDIEDQRLIKPGEWVQFQDIALKAFQVDHSTRAPAVGYRVTAGQVTIFYVPDVVWIHDRGAALAGAKLYIGDGATITRSMVRKIDEALIGHTPIRTQLTWCQKEDVPRAIFTHCGSQIVEGDERSLGAKIRGLAEERGIDAQIAYDKMEVVLR
jgi:phosphoribosyl 1,2-cyclic phosphodiesterase